VVAKNTTQELACERGPESTIVRLGPRAELVTGATLPKAVVGSLPGKRSTETIERFEADKSYHQSNILREFYQTRPSLHLQMQAAQESAPTERKL